MANGRNSRRRRPVSNVIRARRRKVYNGRKQVKRSNPMKYVGKGYKDVIAGTVFRPVASRLGRRVGRAIGKRIKRRPAVKSKKRRKVGVSKVKQSFSGSELGRFVKDLMVGAAVGGVSSYKYLPDQAAVADRKSYFDSRVASHSFANNSRDAFIANSAAQRYRRAVHAGVVQPMNHGNHAWIDGQRYDGMFGNAPLNYSV
jgi:hypothetical protein